MNAGGTETSPPTHHGPLLPSLMPLKPLVLTHSWYCRSLEGPLTLGDWGPEVWQLGNFEVGSPTNAQYQGNEAAWH